MKFKNAQITAPVLNMKTHSETEVFGGTVFLALHAKQKQKRPLMSLHEWLTPAIETKQYLFISDEVDGKHRPIMFLNWGNLSQQSESQYVDNPDIPLAIDEWMGGDRMWIFDHLSPFGHALAFNRLAKNLFPSHCFRFLDHKGAHRGVRVVTFRGRNVSREIAAKWWSSRPILTHKELIGEVESTSS